MKRIPGLSEFRGRRRPDTVAYIEWLESEIDRLYSMLSEVLIKQVTR